MAAQKAINSMSFEESLTELEGIVRNLETGKSALEESITAYERGMELKKHCEKKLRDAQAKIEKIIVGKDGALSTKPLDTDE
jgi:exodeoxyribonuclease VII small subunit